MPEESIDEVLRKATAERKPLTDQEMKEAMVVAGEVWKKAMERTKEFKEGEPPTLREEDDKGRTYVYIDPQKQRLDLIDSPDLRIQVSRQTRNNNGQHNPAWTDIYKISPTSVTKTHQEHTANEGVLQQALSTEDPLQMESALNDYHQKMKEQGIQESYHPDRADLQRLLVLVSSAKPVVSSVKIVRE